MMLMPVPQHLDSEQINYEFPPKSHLKALAYLDQLEEEYSFFDETSFTSLSNDSTSSSSSLSGYFDEHQEDDSSATTPPRRDYSHHLFSSLIDEKQEDLDLTHITTQHDYHMTQEQLVDDNRLSPLQLPAQAHYSYHQRDLSCDSTTTITKNLIVAPQSFLSMPSTPLYKTNNNRSKADPSALVHPSTCPVTQTESYIPTRLDSLDSLDLPIIISETEPILDQDDDDNDRDSMTSDYLYSHQQQPHVVLIRINKHNKNQQPQDRCPTSLTYLASDEGYDDEYQDGKLSCQEIESASVFLPLEDDEDYGLSSSSSTNNKVQSTWLHFQQQQQQWTRRIQYLEQQLNEERAMRQAFEKAMEDMTVLMDQQQKVLYDRLEQEISMRQAYEHKVQQTAAHVQPLEARLEKETTARIQLEETMVHVLDQLELLHSQHQQHVSDDATQRKVMQKKLDKALDDISELTEQKTAAASKVMARPTRPTFAKSPAAKSTLTNSRSIVPSSKRSKSGLESQKQSPSSSKRLVFHR